MDLHASTARRTTGDVAGIAAALRAGRRRGRAAMPTAAPPCSSPTRARQTEAVRALLDAGADVDLQDDILDNPFLYAGAEGLLDILRLVNEAGADPAITNRYGGIALIPASERGHVETVRYLLAESDVDVDHVNRLGWTALLEAILLSDGGPRHQDDRGAAASSTARIRRPGRRRRGAAARPCPGSRPGRDRAPARGGRGQA